MSRKPNVALVCRVAPAGQALDAARELATEILDWGVLASAQAVALIVLLAVAVIGTRVRIGHGVPPLRYVVEWLMPSVAVMLLILWLTTS